MKESTYVCVFASGSLGVVAVARSLLEAERIEYFVKNEDSHSPYATYNFATGPIEIWVGADDAEEGRTLLKDLADMPWPK